MSDILGKWQQPEGQPFPGLWFEFKVDGTFQAVLESMGVTSEGSYTTHNGEIDMEQTEHTFGLVGKFEGRYVIEGDTLIMTLSDLGEPRPGSLEGKNRRIYKRIA
ncbi:MAG: hypothetical protein JXB35_17935 [Anaerolineae bacterium]|nr:hypothetical protein [Anaerolineae bacterium]